MHSLDNSAINIVIRKRSTFSVGRPTVCVDETWAYDCLSVGMRVNWATKSVFLQATPPN